MEHKHFLKILSFYEILVIFSTLISIQRIIFLADLYPKECLPKY